MEEFRIGDYALIKYNVIKEEELLEDTVTFQGQIQEINEFEKSTEMYTIELDAQSLNQLPDKYIFEALDAGEDLYSYTVYATDLVKTQRRDTDEKYDKALERLDEINDAYLDMKYDFDEEEEIEDFDYEETEILIGKFNESDDYKDLKSQYKKDSDFVIVHVSEFMFNYCSASIKNFSTDELVEVCLGYVPAKVIATTEQFESYAPVLIQFIKFLGKQNLIESPENYIEILEEISEEIVSSSQDKENWDMAKTLVMGGIEKGFDMTNENDIKQYFSEYKQQLKEQNIRNEVLTNIVPKIGRNEKVSVKYTDGEIVENVKFKKILSDLENGKCELIGNYSEN